MSLTIIGDEGRNDVAALLFMRKVKLTPVQSRKGHIEYWYFEYGRGPGERIHSGEFTYVNPQTIAEKKFNKERLGVLNLELTRRQVELINGFGPRFRQQQLQKNFMRFFRSWMEENKREGNRHVQGCFNKFAEFIKMRFPHLDDKQEIDLPGGLMDEELCLQFRTYLLDHLTGDTPMNYYSRFKKMLSAATKAGYFKENPSDEIKPKKGKENKPKDVLTAEEVGHLLKVPSPHPGIRRAFAFALFTGVRGEAVRALTWADVSLDKGHISILQGKTGKRVDVPLLDDAVALLPEERGPMHEKVFDIPSSGNGCNKALQKWIECAGIQKEITFHCARHTVGTLLKKQGVGIRQIADILGHKSTRYAEHVYTRMSAIDEKRELLRKLSFARPVQTSSDQLTE